MSEVAAATLLAPRQLTVLTTSRCNAACDHCCMNSGPRRKEKLTTEQIRAVIDDLHEASPLELVIFAGGEPTLLRDDLLDAIAYVDSLGLVSRLVTNAFWARTPDRAAAMMTDLRDAGLMELNISADDFHLPYIPFERVAYAWEASKGLGFSAVVIANCHGPKSTITPAWICEQLGEAVPFRYDDGGQQQPLGEPAVDGTVYAISNAYIQRLGRGHATIAADDVFIPEEQDDLDLPCPWAVRSAALSPAGHLVACCGIETEGNEVLDFGSVAEGAQRRVVQADNDVIVNAIALRGPMFLKRFLEEHEPSVDFRDDYGSVCEICEHITQRPDAVAALRRHTGALATHVLAVRS